MATKKKMLEAAAGGAGGAGLNITDVFSTYLYEGNGSARTITNGIDLATEGGLWWSKQRTSTGNHTLFSTARGANRFLNTNTTGVDSAGGSDYISFNTDGISILSGANSGNSGWNTSYQDYTSWTFRKAKKFFDVVTYTGNSVTTAISHDLGSTPGMILVKRTDTAAAWTVYHRSNTAAPETDYLVLNTTAATADYNGMWGDTAPTDTHFTVGNALETNASPGTYIAYLFAHNNGDGTFGPDADQDIIKCGSYEGNDSNTTEININLGFEPQWLLIKNADLARSWTIVDVMRGLTYGPAGSGAGTTDRALSPNLTASEETASSSSVVTRVDPTPTGFAIRGKSGICNEFGTHIYMAIRRGPLAPPEAGTEVFKVSAASGSPYNPNFAAPFSVDMAIQLRTQGGVASYARNGSRLTGTDYLVTSSAVAAGTSSNWQWDYNEGFFSGGASGTAYAPMWKRAPSFFDAVAYTGTAPTSRTVDHNLGVAPEMIWVKVRETTGAWYIYHSAYGATKYSLLNTAQTFDTGAQPWADTAPTDTNFTVGSWNNGNGNAYIAYLFASLDGVSKLGSYTGDSTNNRLIDCGFTGGARFVLIKQNISGDTYGSWYVWDSVRGIVSGNDSRLSLNNTLAQNTVLDDIDPNSSGFEVNISVNDNNKEYIYYAIA